MSEVPVRKKVAAFPFEIRFLSTRPSCKGSVLKLTKVGLIVEAQSLLLTPNEQVEVEFTLPVFKDTIKAILVCIKTYDHSDPKASSPDTKVRRLTELHFKSISAVAESILDRFLAQLKSGAR
ncbi:MAG: hypothetical protein COT74_03835 [Bdellovibrionales bacterium CG10_big_fil_rev_8_21_14_0_10_45_34]|nr:MAG: hypothetical protein COT74_03835 [Bdellovibrionales bacterium CG10_big_fil_rev_8_21_14_0_10_45_34]